MFRFVSKLNDNIVRVSYSMDDCEPKRSELISDDFTECESKVPRVRLMGDTVEFLSGEKCVLRLTEASLTKKEVYEYFIDGEPVFAKKQTANGEVSYIENAENRFEGYSYSGRVCFEVGDDELLLGLGQYEDGVFDYRNRTEYLYESNMRIAIPYLITTGGYSIFLDTESNSIFTGEGNRVTFDIDTTKTLSVYVILGDSVQEMIASFQELTGRAAMLPKWAYGYLQSKERYQTGQELIDVASEFRRRHIPVDCLVQDWFTWENGLWGEKIFDKKRYPDLPGTVKQLHDMGFHFMVSIWPNMSTNGKNYEEFRENDGLLKNANVYNAFEESGRSLYWRQCMDEIMKAGTDALWCDNSEPFSDADWNGTVRRPEALRYELVVNDSKKSMDWEKINSYGLFHAKGIYENWRRDIPGKRVVNLTRSGYVSSQKYGVILWSGDICARWETLKNQVVEGMKMGLCGNPYWTLDIGGFFTSKNCDASRASLWFWNGDFPKGVNDPGYRELYTRWLQFGCFLPIFRSHGTDTPREPWNFINRDEVALPFYETIVKFIQLRYRLLPYIYSLGYKMHRDAYITMRSLVFDFCEDKKALECTDEYMFGSAFLVAPVLEPMYYGPNEEKLSRDSYTRSVYLPNGCDWYDFWSKAFYAGGQTVELEADIETMPLMVKAGSIIPMAEPMESSGEDERKILELYVYEGADGSFELYNDSGDGYEYLTGDYSLVKLCYDDSLKKLYFHEKLGSQPMDLAVRLCFVRKDGSSLEKKLGYRGEEIAVDLL